MKLNSDKDTMEIFKSISSRVTVTIVFLALIKFNQSDIIVWIMSFVFASVVKGCLNP